MMTVPLTITLAVDGSDHSLAGARLVRDLILTSDSQVRAVAVLRQRLTPGHAALLHALENVSRIVWGGLRDDRIGILHGHPAEAITHFAGHTRSNLIVVGALGLRVSFGILLGGVAQQVVEYSTQPVLVVRAEYRRLERILLAVDGSSGSDEATEYLAGFPVQPGAEVICLHVISPADGLDLSLLGSAEQTAVIVPGAEQAQREREEQQARDLLKRTRRTLKARGIAARAEILHGPVAERIIELANAIRADLIVVGARGVGAVQGWCLGSVSRKLVHYSGRSVLVVKSNRG